MSTKIERIIRKARGSDSVEDLQLTDVTKPGTVMLDNVVYVELQDGRLRKYKTPSQLFLTKGLVWQLGKKFVSFSETIIGEYIPPTKKSEPSVCAHCGK